jgi:uncharacterized protein YecE (DUF72 family)
VDNLRIGTSGWNYPSGKGTWNGVFYPPSRGRSKAFDELSYYAEHFNTVEVNSTFYGQPREAVCRDWASRTPAGFEFSVKLYQKFTHPGMYQKALRKSLGGEGVSQAALVELSRPSDVDLDEFKRGIDPLATVGKLGALLAQFPASFRNEEPERNYLAHLLERLPEYAVAVELRHKSWSDSPSDTLAMLAAFDAAWVQIDEPKFRLSIRQNLLPNTNTFYYQRLHGRNAAQWWRHEQPEDRYNYEYSSDELREFSDSIGAVRHLVKKAYLYANNHFSAKSVANATEIKAQLNEPLIGEYREEFLERYPHLRQLGAQPAGSQPRAGMLIPRP